MGGIEAVMEHDIMQQRVQHIYNLVRVNKCPYSDPTIGSRSHGDFLMLDFGIPNQLDESKHEISPHHDRYTMYMQVTQ